MSNNFVNDAIMGKYSGNTIGQFEFFDVIMAWWNNLDDIIKYGLIAGVGLIAVVVVFSMFKPVEATGTEKLEELLRLKMVKELAED